MKGVREVRSAVRLEPYSPGLEACEGGTVRPLKGGVRTSPHVRLLKSVPPGGERP